MAGEIIIAASVSKIYNRGRSNETCALRNVSVALRQNDFAVLKGPSGSGKTTLLSLLGCMSRPTSGSILVHDRDISHLPESFLTGIRRKTYGFIFQQFNLIQGMTVLQNILIPMYPTGAINKEVLTRAQKLLEELDMLKRSDYPVNSLSGGEQQRTAIARALINNPEVILADEPTAHLDTKLAADFMEIMRRLRNSGKTVIIASHDPLVFEDPGVTLSVSMRDGSVMEITKQEISE